MHSAQYHSFVAAVVTERRAGFSECYFQDATHLITCHDQTFGICLMLQSHSYGFVMTAIDNMELYPNEGGQMIQQHYLKY